MDSDRFDALARSLSIPGTRRAAVAATLGGLTSLLGLASAWAGNGNGKGNGNGNGKNRKKKCLGYRCGKACCDGLNENCCNGACIPQTSCCLPGGALPEGARHKQCGICENGLIYLDREACLALDPDGCTKCSDSQCVPGFDGVSCPEEGSCRKCSGGLCEAPAGSTFCPDGGPGKCVPAGQTCCRAGTIACGTGGNCCSPPAICCHGVCCANTDGTSKCCNGKKLCYSTEHPCPPA